LNADDKFNVEIAERIENATKHIVLMQTNTIGIPNEKRENENI
jgi:hypothetical protein